jgi:hypothetical protein
MDFDPPQLALAYPSASGIGEGISIGPGVKPHDFDLRPRAAGTSPARWVPTASVMHRDDLVHSRTERVSVRCHERLDGRKRRTRIASELGHDEVGRLAVSSPSFLIASAHAVSHQSYEHGTVGTVGTLLQVNSPLRASRVFIGQIWSNCSMCSMNINCPINRRRLD